MALGLLIVKVLLTSAFYVAGSMKVMKPKSELAEKMAWVDDFSDTAVKSIGIYELLAAAAIALPLITKVPTIATQIGSGALAILMVGAAFTHFRR